MAIIITDRTSTATGLGPSATHEARKNRKVFFRAVRTFLDQRPPGVRKARKRKGRAASTSGERIAGRSNGKSEGTSGGRLTKKPVVNSSAISANGAVQVPQVSKSTTTFARNATTSKADSEQLKLRDGLAETDQQASPMHRATSPRADEQLRSELSLSAGAVYADAPGTAALSTTKLPTRPKTSVIPSDDKKAT